MRKDVWPECVDTSGVVITRECVGAAAQVVLPREGKEFRMCKPSSLRTSFVVLCLLFAFVLAGGGYIVQAQTPQPGAQQNRSMGMMKVDEGQASALMAERQQLMNTMHAMDQKLKDLVTQMDASTGEKKADAIATVVKELVAERTSMSGRMMMMQDGIMRHMMLHMMSMQGGMMSMMNRGGQSAATQSLDACPVMKGLAQEAVRGQLQKK